MIDLGVDKKYIGDLHDDVFGNYEDSLYKFLNNDPVRAFYFGSLIKKWFNDLDQSRQLLYSKGLRHCGDDLAKYTEQTKFWLDKFTKDDEEDIDTIEFSEFLLNNMFWDNESDIINMALFLGGKVTIPVNDGD